MSMLRYHLHRHMHTWLAAYRARRELRDMRRMLKRAGFVETAPGCWDLRK